MDSGTFPFLLGFLILIAILTPTILLWITYRKYKRVVRALPDAEAIAQSEDKALKRQQVTLQERLLEDWKSVPDDEIEMARHALWTAMLLEASADGNVDNREMMFVADLFGKLGESKMDFRPIIAAAEMVHSDKKGALREVSKAKRLGPVAKEQILAGAFLVSVSDHSLSDHELACIMDIANALGLSERDRKAMLTDIKARFEG